MSKFFSKRWSRLWLLLIIILAAILRFPTLGTSSLWFDEAISYLAASLPINLILNNAVQSSHPPLYYLLLKAWTFAFPDSDSSLRVLGLVWNLLLIPAAYLLVRELNGRRVVAILACLLIAISPFHILYSHEVRMYTMLMFLVTLGTYTYLRAVREDRWYWWLIFAVVFAMAVFTHVFAWLALFALGIYTIVRFRRSSITAKFIVIGTLLVIIFLPWLLQMMNEQESELGSLRPVDQEVDYNPIKLLTSLSFLLFGMASHPILVGLSLFLILSIGILLIIETIKAHRNSEIVWSSLPILMLITLVIVPVFIYMIRPFFLPERTMAAASPFLIILLAWSATRSRTPLPYLVIIAVVLMLVNAIIYIVGEPIKPPYREASEFVEERLQPGDQVLHTSDGSYLPWLRYTNNDKHALLIGDPDPRKPDSIYRVLGGTLLSRTNSLEDGTRLWLIVALEHSQEWQKEQVDYFVDRYHRLEQFNVGGIDILLFELSG